jgi:carbon storage regulator CsrA
VIVLSRKVGETLVINDTLRVTVLEIHADSAMFEIEGLDRAAGKKVMSLRKNHQFSISEGITLILVDTRTVGDESKARIGVEASSQVTVHRNEVLEAIRRRKRTLLRSLSDPQLEVAFGPELSAQDIENCLEYLSLLYRNEGGVGLRVVDNLTMAPELAEVPSGY